MARNLLEKYECDRCAREWLVPYKEGDKVPPVSSVKVELVIEDNVHGVEFGHLCSTCVRTVHNHVEAIIKNLKGKSPDRAKKKRPAAPSTPPPKPPTRRPEGGNPNPK